MLAGILARGCQIACVKCLKGFLLVESGDQAQRLLLQLIPHAVSRRGYARAHHRQDKGRGRTSARAVLDKLDELNQYARRYHHGENPNAAMEPLNAAELQGYVRQTLRLVGCLL